MRELKIKSQSGRELLITKEEAESRKLHYIEDGFGECYYTVLKDPKQLDKVFKYYDKK